MPFIDIEYGYNILIKFYKPAWLMEVDMKDFLKSALKTFTGYFIALIVFLVFLYVFMSISKDNFSNWLPVYSFITFLLLFLLLYSDFNVLAKGEKTTV